jgi:hypothetical protein
LTQLDPEINPEDIEKSHSYLANESLQLLIDSIGVLMADERSQDRLKVVKT